MLQQEFELNRAGAVSLSLPAFYAILKEIDEDGPSDREPKVVKETGEPVEQYPPPGEGW